MCGLQFKSSSLLAPVQAGYLKRGLPVLSLISVMTESKPSNAPLRRLAASVTDNLCYAPVRSTNAKDVTRMVASFAALEPTMTATSECLTKIGAKLGDLKNEAEQWDTSTAATDSALRKLDQCLEVLEQR